MLDREKNNEKLNSTCIYRDLVFFVVIALFGCCIVSRFSYFSIFCCYSTQQIRKFIQLILKSSKHSENYITNPIKISKAEQHIIASSFSRTTCIAHTYFYFTIYTQNAEKKTRRRATKTHMSQNNNEHKSNVNGMNE